MPSKNKVLIIIPALNESAVVGKVVRNVIAAGYSHVVVVDDYSDDRTAEEAREAGATVISPIERLGAWGASQVGLRYAVRKGFRLAVTIDADGQHSAEDIDVLLKDISDRVNVVIGADPSRGSLARKVAWMLLRHLSGLDLSDITSGFRAYDRLAIRRLAAWPATLVEYQDIGILLALQKYGLGISEVPVRMAPREDGISRVFSSWTAVFYYMAHTCLLSVSKRVRKRTGNTAQLETN